MTNREAISYFKTFAVDRTGFAPDDYGFSNKSLIQLLFNNRARVIKEMLNVKMLLSHQTIQTLPCIKLEEVDMIESIPQDKSGCIWLRSIDPVPTTIKNFSLVSTIGNVHFNFVEWDKLKHKLNSRSKTTRDSMYWTYRDTGEGLRIYVLNTEYLESVSQNAVFENPIKADQFPQCGEKIKERMCNPLDLDFHTQEDLIERVMTKTINEYLERLRLMQPDIFNDDQANAQGVADPRM